MHGSDATRAAPRMIARQLPAAPLRRLCFAVAVCAGAACSGSPQLVPVASPAEIPALEARVAGTPGDVGAGVRLAAAYRQAGRGDEAAELVATLSESAPDEPGVSVLVGLLAEDEGDYALARTIYEDLIARVPDGEFEERLRERLSLVRAEELRVEVRRTLEREADIAQTAPDPRTVGVFPFQYEGSDPEWEPLALAIPELLVTDLAVTGRLTVLERTRIQILLGELALGAAGRTEPATAARTGRLLGSGHVVQGRFRVDEDRRVSVDAAVVEVRSAGSDTVDPLSADDDIERLFDLEKRLALDIHAEMGIELTPAERVAITERQTESVQALLAFGRGLAAEDEGDFAGAQRQFMEAARIDPSFELAQVRRIRAAGISAARGVASGGRLSVQARRLVQQHAIRLLRGSPGGAQRILGQLDARQRSVLAELLGQDRVGQTTLLEIVFRPPGGRDE